VDTGWLSMNKETGMQEPERSILDVPLLVCFSPGFLDS